MADDGGQKSKKWLLMIKALTCEFTDGGRKRPRVCSNESVLVGTVSAVQSPAKINLS
jgi:hypothetical protein